MNWTAIGAVGELVGGFVVIVTVFYLALQLRGSIRQAEAATELSWVQGLNEIWDRWSRPDTLKAIRAGMQDFEKLDKNQKAIFQLQVGSLINHLETARRLADRKLLPDSYSDVTEDILQSILSTRGGLQYWEFDSKFTPDGDERMRKAKSSDRSIPSWQTAFPWWQDDD